MNAHKKFPIYAIILIIVGVGLILFGAIGPSIIFGKQNSYNIEIDRSGFNEVDIKIEIVTKQQLSENAMVYVDDEEFSVVLKKIDDKTYRGTVELDNDYFMTNEEDVLVYAKSISGEDVSLKFYDDFTNEGFKVALTVFPIMLGLMLALAGLSSGLAVKNSHKIKRSVNTAVSGITGAVSSITKAFKGDTDTLKSCEYCGCDNKPDEVKCEQCGAPLKKSK